MRDPVIPPGTAGVSPVSASRLEQAWHSRGYLQHVKRPGPTQFITFRLADALSEGDSYRLREPGEGRSAPQAEVWVFSSAAYLGGGAGAGETPAAPEAARRAAILDCTGFQG